VTDDTDGDADPDPGSDSNSDSDRGDALSLADFHDAVEAAGSPVLTAQGVADAAGIDQATASEALDDLAATGDLRRRDVSADPVVYVPADWVEQQERERVVAFPDRRELVVDNPTQATRARLSRVARLQDTNGSGGYRYEFRPADVWAAPFDDVEAYLDAVRSLLPDPDEGLEDWLREQWLRARRFRLYTHEDGYTVLEAASADLLGNVAEQELEGELRAPISDTEAWVNEEETASLKRTLYEAGYPVQDERDLASGDRLDVDLRLPLRDYQAEWVERFREQGAGTLVGPPGSGKTVAAMGALTAIGGETLILVPGRELAAQWREELLAHTTLTPDQVGAYHGGRKEVRPVTVATYQTAGMDRHRHLFDERRWGLVVFDEAHHVPAPVFKRTVSIQGKHRLGLTATPVRGDGDEKEIYTLIGPPIGTDWDALFDRGYVQEPEVELRFVPWAGDPEQEEYAVAVGNEKRRLAATNPAKDEEVAHLLDEHGGKALIFVDYLDQGERLADGLGLPFVSGETRHAERERLFGAFRRGEEPALVVSRVGDEGIDLPDAELAVVASGLGGSRRQGAQRAGRTMRPEGEATVYVLATRGTREEDFARRQVRHLAAKGVPVSEADASVAGD
jgi:DNA excision repair protein ERCC-3